MPPIKKVLKNCCPLCDEVAPLTHRYDVCTSCHQDLVSEKLTESEPDPDSSDDESELDDESSHSAAEGGSAPDEPGLAEDSKEDFVAPAAKIKTLQVADATNSNSKLPNLAKPLSRTDSNILYRTLQPTKNVSTSSRKSTMSPLQKDRML